MFGLCLQVGDEESREQLIKTHYMARVGELTTQLQISDSKAVHFHSEVKLPQQPSVSLTSLLLSAERFCKAELSALVFFSTVIIQLNEQNIENTPGTSFHVFYFIPFCCFFPLSSVEL